MKRHDRYERLRALFVGYYDASMALATLDWAKMPAEVHREHSRVLSLQANPDPDVVVSILMFGPRSHRTLRSLRNRLREELDRIIPSYLLIWGSWF